MPHTHHPILLIVNADEPARTQLAAQLDLDGYVVHEAADSSAAVDRLHHSRPDALILATLEAPGVAERFLRTLRAGSLPVRATLPVITIGAGDPVTQLRAYGDGADYHLTPGAPYAVQRAVLAAMLRRALLPMMPRKSLTAGSLEVDPVAHIARLHGEPVELSGKEFALLRTLASDPARVFTKDELLRDIWGFKARGTTRTLDSHACRLRRKLAIHGEQFVVNIWGVGYRLNP